MIRRISVCLVVLLASLGCGPNHSYTASRATLPDEKLALVYDDEYVYVTAVNDEPVEKWQPITINAKQVLRLPPGVYRLSVKYMESKGGNSYKSSMHDQLIRYDFAAGKSYTFGRVRRTFDGMTLWKPLLFERSTTAPRTAVGPVLAVGTIDPRPQPD